MRFSVVIPTYDRPEPLRRCLEGFTRLDHPSWELLVVNDGGKTSFAIRFRRGESTSAAA